MRARRGVPFRPFSTQPTSVHVQHRQPLPPHSHAFSHGNQRHNLGLIDGSLARAPSGSDQDSWAPRRSERVSSGLLYSCKALPKPFSRKLVDPATLRIHGEKYAQADWRCPEANASKELRRLLVQLERRQMECDRKRDQPPKRKSEPH